TKPSGAGNDSKTLLGDANEDGSVTVADAVLIMQYIVNADAFLITEQGLKNADVAEIGNGVTSVDALGIQCLILNLIDGFPFDTSVLEK
ncbi:MAG: hypothetical protein K2J39_09000, partial [Ruminococcus sp.]|nr:hypothetical protein [Ruminococcus sp.]